MNKLVCILLICTTAFVSALAQEHTPTAAAKDEFDKARTLPFSDKGAAALYRKAIDLDPEFYEAHHYYIMAYSDSAAPQSATDEEKKAARKTAAMEIEELYQGWAKEHPDKAVYQWALGIMCDYSDPDKAVRYYQQAVKIDPKYGPAYDMLATSAEEHGDLALSQEYARKAAESWPNDPKFFTQYIGAWHDADHDADIKKATEICLQGAEKFPDHAAAVLSYLATRARTETESRRLSELVWQKFPKQAPGGLYPLTPLFSIYLKIDRAKALAFAQEMAKASPGNKDWPLLENYAHAIIDAESLIAQGKASDAISTLDAVQLPRYGADRLVLELTQAKAVDAGGQTEKAYNDLLQIYTKTPGDELRAALLGYGKKLGKDAKHVDADVWEQRSASAKPGVPLSLVSYTTGKRVSLDDYKGRVFLVNFFYPKCGPCRGEFPFLQSVLDKYKSRGFDILAINGNPPEDGWVMPLMKGWKLGFLPLKGNKEVVKAYKVRGFPSNFLYGPDGRIYYKPPPVQGLRAQRELELQIEGLIAQVKPAKKTQ